MASETTVTESEYAVLNAIDRLMNEPGSMSQKYEAMIPDLIRRGLITQHTVWRLTIAGEKVVDQHGG